MSIMYICKLVCIHERGRERGEGRKIEKDDIYEHIRGRLNIYIHVSTIMMMNITTIFFSVNGAFINSLILCT